MVRINYQESVQCSTLCHPKYDSVRATALAMAGCAHSFAPVSRDALLVLKAEGQGEPRLGAGYPGRASRDSSVPGRKGRGSEGG